MNIGIKIVERKPIVEGSPRLICGNSGDTITFTFDSEWSNYTAKVARFVYVKNGVVESQEVLFNGNVAEIPVLSNITEVFIGVYTGDLRTTTPVTIPCDFSILCKGGEPVDPTPDIYAQILDALNAKLILEGNASSATKLETPRTIQVDLEKSDGASFDGTEDVTPGVTGVLPKEHGGTGTPTPELIFAPHGVKRVNGSAVAVDDSSNSPLANLKLFGKTEQDGTPTPTEPKELKSVGDSGSFEVGVYRRNLLELEASNSIMTGVTYTVNKEEGYIEANGTATEFSHILVTMKTENLPVGSYILSGCPSGGGGNKYALYTNGITVWDYGKGATFNITKDSKVLNVVFCVYAGTTVNNLRVYPMLRKAEITDNTFEPCNKQSITMPYELRSVRYNADSWVRDEIDLTKGINTEKTVKYTFNGSESWQVHARGFILFDPRDITNYPHYCWCDKYPQVWWNDLASCDYGIFASDGYSCFICVKDKDCSTVEEFKSKLASNPITVIGIRQTPIETPLTETELNAYRQLYTNKGTTTILSYADLEVDYYTDTLSGEMLGNLHSSLYSEIETLKQAIVSLGGEV